MCAAMRSATRGEKIGSESEKRTSVRLLPVRELLAHRQVSGQVGVVGGDRDEPWEGEDPGLRLGHRPGRAVGRLDLLAHRLHGRDLDEPAGDDLGPESHQPVAEAQPLLGRRPAAADAGVHDHEPADPVGMLDREAKTDRAAPVLDDDGRVAQVELLDEPDDRRRVEVVGVVLDQERLVRAPEAEVVGRDRPSRRR